MKQGSVIVDLSAEAGGNCEATKPNEIYTKDGVTIIGMMWMVAAPSVADYMHTGYTDLPSRLPTQSSTLYSNNVTKFFLSMTEKDNFVINLEDEVVRGSIVVHKGEVLPPAPMAAPPPVAPSPAATKTAEEEATKALTPWQKATRDVTTVTAGMGGIVALGKFTGPALMSNFFTFGLASLIGYRVVWGVSPAVRPSSHLCVVALKTSFLAPFAAHVCHECDLWYRRRWWIVHYGWWLSSGDNPPSPRRALGTIGQRQCRWGVRYFQEDVGYVQAWGFPIHFPTRRNY